MKSGKANTQTKASTWAGMVPTLMGNQSSYHGIGIAIEPSMAFQILCPTVWITKRSGYPLFPDPSENRRKADTGDAKVAWIVQARLLAAQPGSAKKRVWRSAEAHDWPHVISAIPPRPLRLRGSFRLNSCRFSIVIPPLTPHPPPE